MDYNVRLIDNDLDVKVTIASFLDFTTLQCCVPSICLMLHQQGYKSQDLVITFFEGLDFSSSYTIKLSDFKSTKSWTIQFMTDIGQYFHNFYHDRFVGDYYGI